MQLKFIVSMYCYGNTVMTDELWFSMHECMIGVDNLTDTQMCIIKGSTKGVNQWWVKMWFTKLTTLTTLFEKTCTILNLSTRFSEIPHHCIVISWKMSLKCPCVVNCNITRCWFWEIALLFNIIINDCFEFSISIPMYHSIEWYE